MSSEMWKPCSACKKPIPLGGKYWVCSVSTCNRARSPFVFCSLACWDSHVPVMNHRDAWAEERTAPREHREAEVAALPRASAPSAAPRAFGPSGNTPAASTPPRPSLVPGGSTPGGQQTADPRRRIVRAEASEPVSEGDSDQVLIVASRLKQYIRERSGMNTSAEVLEVLSDEVRYLTNKAIRNAERHGRKTVMARDFKDDSEY